MVLFIFLSVQANAQSGNIERFIFLADGGKITNESQIVFKSVVKSGVKDIVMAGDNLYSSSNPNDYGKVWGSWLQAGLRFPVVAIGNHNAGYNNEMKFFGMPTEFYSRILGNNLARFIVLNSDNPNNVPAQMKFLEQEFQASTEPFLFLVYHHPTFTMSSDHNWEEKKSFQLSLRPLLKKYRSKLTAVLIGHDHLAAYAEWDGLPVILSGAVQSIRQDHPVNNTQNGVRVETKWYFDGTPFWTLFSFPAHRQGVVVDYIKASEHLAKCSVMLRTGQPSRFARNCLKK